VPVSPVADSAATWVPAVALVALLATAYAHPRGRTEAAIGVLAAGAVLATGTLEAEALVEELTHLGPVVLFLVTILVVGDVCRRAGVFDAAAGLVRRLGRDHPAPLFTGVFLLAALVTTVLSLDATVVLLTPVVLAAAASAGVSARPGAHACLRMANSASLLLPVANLTNLLAMRHLDLTFLGFAAVMGPVLAAVLLVEYAALRVLFRRELTEETDPDHAVPRRPDVPRLPVVTLALMLMGFAVVSPLGVEPFWVSGAAAAVLAVWALRRREMTAMQAVHAGHPAFALFVLCLGVVVVALASGPFGELVRDVVPDATSYVDLLLIAVMATVLANLLTNLSATLLLLPMLAPLGTPAVLAALLGLNIGSGLTYTGSLANLLWRRTLTRHGRRPSLREFHRVSLVVTPVSLVVAVSALAIVTH
jgi:arsenical pump membrane protein